MISAIVSSASKRALCQARLFANEEALTLATLLDLGSDLNIMDETLA